MTITPKTTVHTLLKEHPFLLDFLAGYNPEFKKLTNPVLRRTMGRMATLDTVARQGNVPLNQLMNDIAAEIEAKTGGSPTSQTRRASTPSTLRVSRNSTPIVKELHAGKSVDEVKPRFEELIATSRRRRSPPWRRSSSRAASPTPRSSASATCTCRCSRTPSRTRARHGRRRASHRHLPAREPGPAASDRVAAQARGDDRRAAGPRGVERLKPALAGVLDRLLEIDKHYLRKENQLFPFLEKHGIEGPSQGDVGDPRRHPRADEAGARRARRRRGGARREHRPALAKMVDDMVTRRRRSSSPCRSTR